MKSGDCRIYIRYVDGAEALVPVPARQPPNGSFEILPADDFDFDDDSILFEFGPGDVVVAEDRELRNGSVQRVATRLVTGDSRNIFKRMLLSILLDKPRTSDLTAEFGEAHVAQLRSKVSKMNLSRRFGLAKRAQEHTNVMGLTSR